MDLDLYSVLRATPMTMRNDAPPDDALAPQPGPAGRYLVTGGCGFIGRHLVGALLAGGARVTVLDDLSSGRRAALPEDAELVVGDVADAALLASLARGADGIVHLAAIASVARCSEDWSASHATNMGGTVAVLEAARGAGGIPVAFASSAAIYGTAHALPLTEDAPAHPLSPYGIDKRGGEMHAGAAAALFGVPVTALRFFNVYGPGQEPSSPYAGVISIFVARALAGAPITVHGDGGQSRDFVYVADVVDALAAALALMGADRAAGHAAQCRILNVCTGRATTLAAILSALEAILGRPLDVTHAPAREGDIRHSLGDPARMRAVLGVTARVGLEDGLTALLASLRSASQHTPASP